MGWASGVGGTGVAVGRGVAVGGTRVGGGAGFEDAGRLPRMAELDSAVIKLVGEARLVPGNCASATTMTPSGTSKAMPRTKRSGPGSVLRVGLDPCEARMIPPGKTYAVRVPAG